MDRGYKIPIYGILYYGSCFQFFIFDGTTRPFKFSTGVETVVSGLRCLRDAQLSLFDFSSQPTQAARTSFIHSLRPICESVFNLLLLAYIETLKTHRWSASVDDWDKVTKIAEEALEKSQEAEKLRQYKLIVEADEVAEAALKALKLRYLLQILFSLQLEVNLSTV
jgi:hypothetical protein